MKRIMLVDKAAVGEDERGERKHSVPASVRPHPRPSLRRKTRAKRKSCELQCKCQFLLKFSIENAEIMENCP